MKKFLFPLILLLTLQNFSFAQSLAIYKGAVNKLSGPWVVNCTVASTTADSPFEGTNHYKNTYKINDKSYAGFGFGFNGASIDFTPYTHLHIAYRGMTAGQNMLIYLKNFQGQYSSSYSLPYSATYKEVDIPLAYYAPICSTYDLSKIVELIGSVDGTASGTVFFDAIELVKKNTNLGPADDDPKPSLAASTKTWNRINNVGYGVNVEIYNGGEKATHTYTKKDIENFSKMNIKILRCAIGYEFLMDKNPPYALNLSHEGYKMIDSMIAWTGAYKIKLILDNHIGLDLGNKNYMSNLLYASNDIPRLVAMWKQLTQRYATVDHERVFFELKNEPGINGFGLTNFNLRKINNAMIDAIRLIDKDRTLVIAPTGFSPVDSLETIRPYNDANIIYTFHNYDPYEFTYQGFTWFENSNIDIPFPKAGDAAKLACTFNRAKAWSKKFNVPIFNGEFGASGKADPASRCNYIKTVCAIMDSLAIPATYFSPEGFYYGFGFFKEGIFEYNQATPCFAEALHFKKPDLTYPATKAIYKNGKTEIVNVWKHEMEFQEVTTDLPLEGGQHYKVSYPVSADGWRGGGLQFQNPWEFKKAPLDFTEGNYTHLKLSYKGLPAGQKVTMSLVYNYLLNLGPPNLTQKSKESNPFTLDVNSATYTTIEIPLASLINTNMKGLWFVSGIDMYVNSPTQAGSFYLDEIELVNKNAPPSVFPTGLKTCLEDDFLELKKLYDATSKTAWGKKANWLTNPDMATWEGITLTADGCSIKSIVLNNNNLSGTLPVLNFPELEVFDVYGNSLTGTIPTLTMPKLTALWLSINQFSGSVPDFNMPKLIDLRLRKNELSGKIPAFANTNLKTLFLENNKFIFGDMENKPWLKLVDLNYAPQALIPLTVNGANISVATGSANNVQSFEWYKDGVLIATTQNNVYKVASTGKYNCKIKHNTITVGAIGTSKNLILETEIQNVTVSSTATNDTDWTSQVNIYPNPTSEWLNIDLPNAEDITLQIMDLSGKNVFNKKINTSNPLNISDLSKGTYILKINFDEKIIFKKMVKM